MDMHKLVRKAFKHVAKYYGFHYESPGKGKYPKQVFLCNKGLAYDARIAALHGIQNGYGMFFVDCTFNGIRSSKMIDMPDLLLKEGATPLDVLIDAFTPMFTILPEAAPNTRCRATPCTHCYEEGEA